MLHEEVTSLFSSKEEEDRSKARSKDVIELSHQIIGSAENAVSILDDLLNYDKIERGAMPLELTVVSIWNLIEKAATEFKLPFLAKNIEFTLDCDPMLFGSDIEGGCRDEQAKIKFDAQDLPREVLERRVIGDPMRLTQVIRNLVSNALKFVKPGGKQDACKLRAFIKAIYTGRCLPRLT